MPRTRPGPRALAAEGAGYDQVLDLVGAFADLEDLGVAVEAGDRRVEHVADAAVDLHRLRRGRHREAAGLKLGHGRLLEDELAGVAQVRSAVREPARADESRGGNEVVSTVR